MDPKLGNLHQHKNGSFGYDPYVNLKNGKRKHGDHGLIDIRTEIAQSAYNAGMLNNPLIKDILKK